MKSREDAVRYGEHALKGERFTCDRLSSERAARIMARKMLIFIESELSKIYLSVLKRSIKRN